MNFFFTFHLQDTILCKLILHEYSVKMNMNLPTYETSHKPGLIPAFVSSVLFDNKTFKGETALSKKEAERVAACTVIKYILGLLKLFLID